MGKLQPYPWQRAAVRYATHYIIKSSASYSFYNWFHIHIPNIEKHFQNKYRWERNECFVWNLLCVPSCLRCCIQNVKHTKRNVFISTMLCLRFRYYSLWKLSGSPMCSLESFKSSRNAFVISDMHRASNNTIRWV